MYTNGLKFLRLPISKLFKNKSISLEAVMASNNTISVRSSICKNLNNDVIPCPTSPSSLDSPSQACMYAIMGVKFSIIYNENGITDISVEFIITNVTTKKFNQFHTVQFIEENSLSNTSTLIATDYLSGNLGYLKNYPVRAGYIENNNNTITPYIVMISYPLNPTLYPNEYGRINFGWWPIPNIGDCTNFASQSKTILFGQNTFSSCVLRSCRNIIIGQTINIYYARKGSVYDPQNRIISVHKIYKRGNIGYKCQGYACIDNSQLNTEQKFFITTNVLFHDLTL
ncbi:unnamed protein product [Schistosoma mattheei]|uniref:Uncharacterized protein n=1 Tax=Schistosoma mattheei TaxID=31246 RepID=A0A183P087_9TREM|nr:unnamed protein product [Schistosoma mattheei]